MNGWKRLWILLSIVWTLVVCVIATLMITQSSYNEPSKEFVISHLSKDSMKFYENGNDPTYTVTFSYEDETTQDIQFPLLTEEIKNINFKEKLTNLAGSSGKKISDFEVEKLSKKVELLNSKAVEAKHEFEKEFESSIKANSDRKKKVILYSLVSIVMPLLIILLLGYGIAWVRAGFNKNA